jgi:UDP-N-acetylenolpyruvoylglucosamine reductase
VTIQEYVELAPYTTLGVGGAARWFAETRSDDEILAFSLAAAATCW